MSIAWRICAALNLPSSGQPLDPAAGLPALAAAEDELSVKFEQVLMLGSPVAIRGAREWCEIAWDLEKFARGSKRDSKEYEQINVKYPEARKHFYAAASAELSIVSGDIPEAERRSTKSSQEQQPPDTPGRR